MYLFELEFLLDICPGVELLDHIVRLKIDLPYDPAIPVPGIYPEGTLIQKDTCTPMFIAALYTIAETWKQPKCPSIDDWITKFGIFIQCNTTQPLKRIK